MKIPELPHKSNLTYFNVQYFQNEGGKGKAKHVITVTYSTADPAKAKHLSHLQHVVKFELRVMPAEINRMVKKHLGEEAYLKLKAEHKALSKEGIKCFFGFRKVQYAFKHKFTPGQMFFKGELDTSNSATFKYGPDGVVRIAFNWEGETIEVSLTQHETLVEKQSVAYAYWTPNVTTEQLTQRFEEWKNEKHDDRPADDAIQQDDGSGTDSELTVSSGTGSNPGSVQGETTGGSTEVSGEDRDSNASASAKQLALIERLAKASGMGVDDQAPIAEPKSKRPKTVAKRTQRSKTEPDNPFDSTADVSNILDKLTSPAYTAGSNSGTFDLGTSFRF